jgi:hypothetical protein
VRYMKKKYLTKILEYLFGCVGVNILSRFIFGNTGTIGSIILLQLSYWLGALIVFKNLSEYKMNQVIKFYILLTVIFNVWFTFLNIYFMIFNNNDVLSLLGVIIVVLFWVISFVLSIFLKESS